MKKIIILLLSLCICLPALAANTIMNVAAQKGESFIAVVVEKDKRKLHVVRVTGDGVNIIRTVDVLVGKGSGDKIARGDLKTPEGVYRITSFLSGQRLIEMYGRESAKLYGYGAFPLSYPNLLDTLNGKTGSGIWLHGKEQNRQDPATKGCVALENSDIQNLSQYFTVGTPVIITRNAIIGTQQAYRLSYDSARAAVDEFINAWQSNNFDRFKNSYGKGFRSKDGKSLQAYLNYKKYLMDAYPERKIAADNFRIFHESKDEVVAQFDQYYSAANMTVFGRKTLYFRNEGGQLKIVAEDFEQMRGGNVKLAAKAKESKPVQPEPADKPRKPEPVVAKAEPKKETPVKPAPEKIIAQVEPEKKVEPAHEPEKVTPEEQILQDNMTDIRVEAEKLVEGWKKAWESRNADEYMAYYSERFKAGRMNYEGWKKDKSGKFERIAQITVGIEDMKVEMGKDETIVITFIQNYTGDKYSDRGIKTLTLENGDSGLRIVSEDWRAK
ncbi:L,D-transpeptidase family protein [Seleniivibrio woodruffii]|uniref:L,D-transpeptidase Cds6 family protein n=1 Tax=Seleniivibrio woodruffii TaxID=1078050 RepID=UPI0039E5B925